MRMLFISWKQNTFLVTILKIKFSTGLSCQRNISEKRPRKEVRDSETQYSSVTDFLFLFLPASFSLGYRKNIKSCKMKVITPKLLIVKLIKKDSK